ncbi:OLC1v1000671C1 [Oldenlandia corymbosa var. corymbosa]|uniref:OLC1v1000671C1 n=1 Tax=Oldenlandia corymbosa var. corymbosa TaxID=529605 RepID=A0AAV1D4C2_OLDCO|nr:OLC1v1000671C1 [Oldenlandia corymbosa var. corymbosa]
MRFLEALIVKPELGSVSSSTLPGGAGGGGGLPGGWLWECHGIWHTLFLIVSSGLFLLFLAFQAKKSVAKLSNGRSHIIIAYYAFLWLVTVLNLLWCSLQAWECSSGKEVAWSVLSLFTTSGMLFLEVSLMAFLLQGNYASGQEALTRTFGISGFIVGVDIFLKGIYTFGFGVPLFIDNNEESHRVKWGLWVVHKLLVTGVYGVIFFLYRSRWRERLPARPAFYNYITIMFGLNALALVACALAANGAAFGLWLNEGAVICYHAFYLPLLYVTFLADFFQEEDLNLENVYYSEMKDAGFFDTDWE